MVEQDVLILGTRSAVQSLWLFSVASCWVESQGGATDSSASKTRLTDNIVALFSKICLAQTQKNFGFNLCDNNFARYVLHVNQACNFRGQATGTKCYMSD